MSRHQNPPKQFLLKMFKLTELLVFVLRKGSKNSKNKNRNKKNNQGEAEVSAVLKDAKTGSRGSCYPDSRERKGVGHWC